MEDEDDRPGGGVGASVGRKVVCGGENGERGGGRLSLVGVGFDGEGYGAGHCYVS